MSYSKQLYPHQGTVLVRLLIRPKTAQGFISGEIVDRANATFVIDADTEEECKQQTKELFDELQDTYKQWLLKKNLSAEVAEQP